MNLYAIFRRHSTLLVSVQNANTYSDAVDQTIAGRCGSWKPADIEAQLIGFLIDPQDLPGIETLARQSVGYGSPAMDQLLGSEVCGYHTKTPEVGSAA